MADLPGNEPWRAQGDLHAGLALARKGASALDRDKDQEIIPWVPGRHRGSVRRSALAPGVGAGNKEAPVWASLGLLGAISAGRKG